MNRLLAADPELIGRMTACGFNRVFLGIETPDAGSLSGAGKHQNTLSPLLETVQMITEAGLLVMAGFILGFDGEQAGAGERIVAFVEESAIPLAMVGILQALPNTALWHRLARVQRYASRVGRLQTRRRPSLRGCSATSAVRWRWPACSP